MLSMMEVDRESYGVAIKNHQKSNKKYDIISSYQTLSGTRALDSASNHSSSTTHTNPRYHWSHSWTACSHFHSSTPCCPSHTRKSHCHCHIQTTSCLSHTNRRHRCYVQTSRKTTLCLSHPRCGSTNHSLRTWCWSRRNRHHCGWMSRRMTSCLNRPRCVQTSRS
jgi:hypothetical protein